MVDKDHVLSVCHCDLTDDLIDDPGFGPRDSVAYEPWSTSTKSCWNGFVVDSRHFIRMQTDTVDSHDLLQTTNEPPSYVIPAQLISFTRSSYTKQSGHATINEAIPDEYRLSSPLKQLIAPYEHENRTIWISLTLGSNKITKHPYIT